MAEPNTGGVLRTSIAEMDIGDYVIAQYGMTQIQGDVRTGLNGDYPILNEKIITEPTRLMPVSGYGNALNVSNDYGAAYVFVQFYFIKVDTGLLIADRVCQHSVSWDTLNANQYVEGMPVTVNGIQGIVRCLGGGNSYADAEGNSSTTDAGLGAWPVDSEWDTYIVNKDYGTGAGRDDVWHWSGCATWIQDTPQINIANSNSRAYRSHKSISYPQYIALGMDSNRGVSTIGFRPVFQFEEQ
jgi:hypothetical protein